MLSAKTTKIFLIFVDIQNIPIITISNKAHFKSVNRRHCAAIVSRGDWLGKPANKKKKNNGAVVYVGSSLTVNNPLFFVHKLLLNKLMKCFYWSVSSK